MATSFYPILPELAMIRVDSAGVGILCREAFSSLQILCASVCM